MSRCCPLPARTPTAIARPGEFRGLGDERLRAVAPVAVHAEPRRGLGRDVTGAVVIGDDFDVDVASGETIGFETFQLRVGILDLAVPDGKVQRFGGLEARAVGGLPAALLSRGLRAAVDLRFQFRVSADPPQPCTAPFNARLFGASGAVDGDIVSHIARLRGGTIPGPLLRVHSPGEVLRPGFAGSGGGGGQDAVFPAFRSLQSAFGDPPSGLHLIEGFPGRVGVAPETLPHNVGDGDNAVMTDIGEGGILALGDGVLLR